MSVELRELRYFVVLASDHPLEMRTRPIRRGPICQSYDDLFEAVRAEQAIAVVPESLVSIYAWPGLAFVLVSDIAPATVAVAWPSGQWPKWGPVSSSSSTSCHTTLH